MQAIYEQMDKGESNLTAAQLKTLSAVATAAEKYEDEVLGLNILDLKKLDDK